VGSGVTVGDGVAEGEGRGVKVRVGKGDGVLVGEKVGECVGDGRSGIGVGEGESFKLQT
jgi:hypothetical protein